MIVGVFVNTGLVHNSWSVREHRGLNADVESPEFFYRRRRLAQCQETYYFLHVSPQTNDSRTHPKEEPSSK